MKKLKFYFLLCTLLACFSCTEDTIDAPAGNEFDGKVCLSFNAEQPSRGELIASETDFRHIDNVWVYVFEGTSENDASSKCVKAQDIKWKKGNISAKYWISTKLTENKFYTFLAVGWDGASGEVYSLPGIIKTGTSLNEAMATLADGKSKVEMAKAELFAGSACQKATDNVMEVGITLCRKMAGVLVYLRNVPCKVGDKNVDSVRVMLGSEQNTTMKLWKADNSVEQYGECPLSGDDKCLFLWNTTGWKTDEGGNIFTFPETGNQLENTILKGAYLLPVKAGETENTLRIELWGTDKCLKTFDVTHKGDGNQATTKFPLKENCLYSIGKKISSTSSDGDSPADLTGKDIEVIVDKWDSIPNLNDFNSVVGPAVFTCDIDENNYIFDAMGTEFDININKGNPQESWTLEVDYEGNTERPAGNETFPCDKNVSSRLKDWIHFKTFNEAGEFAGYVNQITDANGGERKITVVLNDYAVKRDLNPTTDGSVTPEGINIVSEELINKFEKDYRVAYLKLTTKNTSVYFRVRQYNTITLGINKDFSDDDAYKNPRSCKFRGMSRLDYGYQFNKHTGKKEKISLEENSDKVEWGFSGSITYAYTDFEGGSTTSMSFFDGEMNLKAVVRECETASSNNIHKGYNGCIFKRVSRKVVDLRTDGSQVKDMNHPSGNKWNENLKAVRTWYVPAQREFEYLNKNLRPLSYNKVSQCLNLFSMKMGDVYWTSTDNTLLYKDAYYIAIGKGPREGFEDNNGNPLSGRKTDLKKVRLIRFFDAENETQNGKQ